MNDASLIRRLFHETWTNRIAPDVMPQNAASHLGLFYLLIRLSSKNEIKRKKSLLLPLKIKVGSPKRSGWGSGLIANLIR